ncbi:MAG: hypothetical protein ABFR36_05630 [Acidobacteriota bacterium]
MRSLIYFVIFFLLFSFINLKPEVIEVNFLKSIGTDFNGLGPLLVKYDEVRNRVVLLNTNSSSISLINGKNNKVENIPVAGRVPQYLKEGSFVINRKKGNIYFLSRNKLIVVFPDTKTSKAFNTLYQYEMIAVDEISGNCFLAGRESKKIAFLDLKKGNIKYKKIFDKTEKMKNLNQTPPPPIRKIIADTELRKIFIFDGYSSLLYTLNINTAKVISKRRLNIKKGERFHFAGYDNSGHNLYIVSETGKRKDIQALKIDCRNGKDTYVDLPELTEGVGITLNTKRDEIYIPYDNHPVVHIVNFKDGGSYKKVDIPSYGNDASAIDHKKDLLYVASWAYGEIYVIDLVKQKLKKRIKDIGILPHMFSIAFNSKNRELYIPLGATAVNGSFGSALTSLNTDTWEKKKVKTGWGPVDLIELEKDGSFLVFNTEAGFAKISSNGKSEYHKLPYPYPVTAAKSDKGNIFLSYGPHQSYWPAVYIWGAKNGILEIDKGSLQIFDRRIPRLAQKIVFDKSGGLYGLQNSWGKEKLFLTYFPNGIRMFAPQKRLYFYSEIERENIQRVLKYDKDTDHLYIVKTAEKDSDNGSLLVVNAEDKMLIKEIETGRTPTDLQFDNNFIFISNFDSDSITKVDKKTFRTTTLKTGKHPLKVIADKKNIWSLNHTSRSIQSIGENKRTFVIPGGLYPDNFALFGKKLYITAHRKDEFRIFSLDTENQKLNEIYKFSYPYGDTSFDTSNTAFYLRGQFGDSIYEISKIKQGKDGKLWITDLLSGRLFIITL